MFKFICSFGNRHVMYVGAYETFINESFYNMRCLVMFITAICLLFLLKLKWPKNKSVYDLVAFVMKIRRCDFKALPGSWF